MAAGGVDGSFYSGGHVDLTAGEAEIRDGLGGTEGGGHLEVCKEPVFQKSPPTYCNPGKRKNGY